MTVEEEARVHHPLIPQEGDYLCWAACAAMLDAAQSNPQGLSQCEIVARALNTDCCDGSTTSKDCDVPLDQLEITNVLTDYCPGVQLLLGSLTDSELESEIFENRSAVQVRWTWTGAAAIDAHVVLVVGGNYELGLAPIYIVHDPDRKQSSFRTMTYEQLVEAEGKGFWSDSWTGL